MKSSGPEDLATKKSTSIDEVSMRVAAGFVALVTLGALGWAAWRISVTAGTAAVASLLHQHAPALLGVPAAAALATVVTGTARAFDVRIELDLLGLRTEGAAATSVLWVAVFLAIVLAIRTLW